MANQSDAVWVVQVTEAGVRYFQTIPASRTLAVDTVGEANGPANDFYLLDANCSVVRSLDVPIGFEHGAVITIAPDGSTTLSDGPVNATRQHDVDVGAMRTSCAVAKPSPASTR